ncbi:hypothetical protein DFJ73DRAFT_822926 [Zopfochytrium polystomum]|nr:hypothetical protein DFJ73DRAFT_822926 [Zopfochytrium polystomum]
MSSHHHHHHVGLQVAATSLLGIFSGAALYISAIEHPGRLANLPQGIRLFKATIIPASKMQGGLAATAVLLSTAAGVLTEDPEWFIPVGAGTAIWALTLGWILPINHKMLALPEPADPGVAASGDVEQGKTLLQTWGRLHWARSVVSTTAFVYMIHKLVKGH